MQCEYLAKNDTSRLENVDIIAIIDAYKGVHAHSCIMGNQGKMAANKKVFIRIQSQLILLEFIYIFGAFSLKRVIYEFKEITY